MQPPTTRTDSQVAYTPEQRDVIRRALQVADKKGASPRVRKALVEAMGVESNFRDLNYGDRDSKGVLQQRNNGAWGAAREDVETDVGQFLDKAMAKNKMWKGSAGTLAQEIQQSGFGGRYDQHSKEADAILKSGGGSRRASVTDHTATPTVESTPGVSHQGDRGAAVLQWLQARKQGGAQASLQLAGALRDIPADTPAQDHLSATQSPSKTTPHPQAAKQSSQGMSRLLELFWEGKGGIDYSKGTRLADGSIGGHSDHVHVAAGPKTVVQLGKEAQRLGLTVSENSHFNGGHRETSGHAPNSYHYKDQAIDVSGDPKLMQHYAAIVAHKYGLKING